MKKHCENCGYIAENEGEKNCPRCGGELKESEKVVAEWGAASPVIDSGASGSAYSSVKTGGNTAVDRDQAKEVRFTRIQHGKRRLFALAFAGLLLDFLYGAGVFVCLPVAILATRDILWLNREKKKLSTQLVWATSIGYIGAVLGLVFLVLMA